MPRMKSPTHQLADAKLGRPLADLVSERRQAGDSWRRISLSIFTETGLDVSGETLRVWFPEAERTGAAS